MEWKYLISQWWLANANAIALIEFGILIVGGVLAWWRHRSLTGRMDELNKQNRSLLEGQGEILSLMRGMVGRPADVQRRIVAKAEEISIRGSVSTGVPIATGNLGVSPRDRDDQK